VAPRPISAALRRILRLIAIVCALQPIPLVASPAPTAQPAIGPVTHVPVGANRSNVGLGVLALLEANESSGGFGSSGGLAQSATIHREAAGASPSKLIRPARIRRVPPFSERLPYDATAPPSLPNDSSP
jgi:hypothetical protein